MVLNILAGCQCPQDSFTKGTYILFEIQLLFTYRLRWHSLANIQVRMIVFPRKNPPLNKLIGGSVISTLRSAIPLDTTVLPEKYSSEAQGAYLLAVKSQWELRMQSFANIRRVFVFTKVFLKKLSAKADGFYGSLKSCHSLP